MSVCLISIIQNLRMKSTLILVCIVSLVRTTTFLMVDIWWMGLKRWWSTAQYQWVTLDGEGYSGSWFWDNNKEVHDTIRWVCNKIRKDKIKNEYIYEDTKYFSAKMPAFGCKEGRGTYKRAFKHGRGTYKRAFKDFQCPPSMTDWTRILCKWKISLMSILT